LGIELLAEPKCNQQQYGSDADNKTGASAEPLRRRWYKRGPLQLLRLKIWQLRVTMPSYSACEMPATTNQQRKLDAETKTQLPAKPKNRRRKHSTLPIIF
jgi:hypothetical protein